MSPLIPSSILLVLLCTSGAVRAQPSLGAGQMTGVPHLVVTAETARQAQEVHISPGRVLILVFDTPVRREGLRMNERERFREISLSEDGLLLSLLPSRELPFGKRLGLTVDFADGSAPTSLDFTLVVHPQSETQIEVYRQPRPLASYQREAEEAQTRLLQCQTDLQKERLARERPPGLLGLLVLKQLGTDGVHRQDIASNLTSRLGESMEVRRASSYRATAGESEAPVMRLAVDLRLSNNGPTPWRPTHARLVGPDGQWEAELWAPEPLAPGEKGRVLVEVERPGNEAPGTYVLELWDEEGQRRATFSGVTFP